MTEALAVIVTASRCRGPAFTCGYTEFVPGIARHPFGLQPLGCR